MRDIANIRQDNVHAAFVTDRALSIGVYMALEKLAAAVSPGARLAAAAETVPLFEQLKLRAFGKQDYAPEGRLVEVRVAKAPGRAPQEGELEPSA